jgi:hypothetical protein
MQRRTQQQQQYQSQRLFSASEVAEYEYCPLVWWHEQYDALNDADDEELFAEMVAMEQNYGAQAPNLPEYQVIERLLLRRGAFDEGRRQHQEHAEEVEEAEEIAEEQLKTSDHGIAMRKLVLFAIILMVLALLIIAASFFLKALLL